MSEGGSSGGEWAGSESKDWKDGRHRRSNQHVLPHAGIVTDRKTRRHLTALTRAYERAAEEGWINPGDGWPARFEGTRLYGERLQRHETETFSDRLERGDAVGVRHHIGSQAEDVDVSGWRDIERIRSIATDRNLRLYIYGEPGNGKTRSACLVGRHWLDERREEGHADARVLTNIRTLVGEDEAIEWVSNWAQFRDLVMADMEDVLAENVPPTLFIFDEASSQASGSGRDGYEASTKLATLVYKMRKFGVAVVIVGHDGKDLHPAVRELCRALHKTDKKVARFYQSVSNRKGKNPITPEITGWPDSMWSPNDKDPAPWSWSNESGDDSPENGDHISREAAFRDLAVWTVVQERTCDPDNPTPFAKIADKRLYGSYSAEWCRQQWQKYEGGEYGDLVGEIQQAIA